MTGAGSPTVSLFTSDGRFEYFPGLFIIVPNYTEALLIFSTLSDNNTLVFNAGTYGTLTVPSTVTRLNIFTLGSNVTFTGNFNWSPNFVSGSAVLNMSGFTLSNSASLNIDFTNAPSTATFIGYQLDLGAGAAFTGNNFTNSTFNLSQSNLSSSQTITVTNGSSLVSELTGSGTIALVGSDLFLNQGDVDNITADSASGPTTITNSSFTGPILTLNPSLTPGFHAIDTTFPNLTAITINSGAISNYFEFCNFLQPVTTTATGPTSTTYTGGTFSSDVTFNGDGVSNLIKYLDGSIGGNTTISDASASFYYYTLAGDFALDNGAISTADGTEFVGSVSTDPTSSAVFNNSNLAGSWSFGNDIQTIGTTFETDGSVTGGTFTATSCIFRGTLTSSGTAIIIILGGQLNNVSAGGTSFAASNKVQVIGTFTSITGANLVVADLQNATLISSGGPIDTAIMFFTILNTTPGSNVVTFPQPRSNTNYSVGITIYSAAGTGTIVTPDPTSFTDTTLAIIDNVGGQYVVVRVYDIRAN